MGSVTISSLSSSKVYWQLISDIALLLTCFNAVLYENLTKTEQLFGLSVETMNG